MRGGAHDEPGPGVPYQTQVVLATGADAGIPGLRPHRCRHTFGTRLRQGGADPAQVRALLGHASIDTAARYFHFRISRERRRHRAHLRPLTSVG
jgi:integrase